MIQNGSVRKALTWSGAMAVFGLASLVLPVAPSFGQEGPEKPEVKEKHKVGLGFMGFFVKAVVEALKAYPLAVALLLAVAYPRRSKLG